MLYQPVYLFTLKIIYQLHLDRIIFIIYTKYFKRDIDLK